MWTWKIKVHKLVTVSGKAQTKGKCLYEAAYFANRYLVEDCDKAIIEIKKEKEDVAKD